MARKKELIKERKERIEWHTRKFLKAGEEIKKLQKEQKEDITSIIHHTKRIQQIVEAKWE